MFGMSPFEGITVGRDPRSPVWWERHLTHGSFPWSGGQGPVTYTPGRSFAGSQSGEQSLLPYVTTGSGLTPATCWQTGNPSDL